jgi:hypothetical protein
MRRNAAVVDHSLVTCALGFRFVIALMSRSRVASDLAAHWSFFPAQGHQWFRLGMKEF